VNKMNICATELQPHCMQSMIRDCVKFWKMVALGSYQETLFMDELLQGRNKMYGVVCRLGHDCCAFVFI